MVVRVSCLFRVVESYSILGDYDPRTHTWRNGTDVEPSSSPSLWTQIRYYVSQYAELIVAVIVTVLFVVCFSCCG